MLIAACAALVLLMLLWPMDTKNTENEAPETVELTIDTSSRTVSDAADEIEQMLIRTGVLFDELTDVAANI